MPEKKKVKYFSRRNVSLHVKTVRHFNYMLESSHKKTKTKKKHKTTKRDHKYLLSRCERPRPLEDSA